MNNRAKDKTQIASSTKKVCNGILTQYSRITGFYQPTTNWNPGKKSEFKDRKKYEVNNESSTVRGH